jgi:hypothetical protein
LKILTAQGKPPRLHDMRHSFAVNALLRWYPAPVRMSRQSFPCCPRTWGTSPWCPPITT